jgi:hypothetical protein
MPSRFGAEVLVDGACSLSAVLCVSPASAD